MKNYFVKSLLVLLTLLVHFPGKAEDIDLFMGVTPTATDAPNILIILDNTANWSTAFVNEKAALVSVLNGLPVNKFNLGLMMFTETGSGNPNPAGAYVRAAIRPMNDINKPLYSALVNSLVEGGDKGNGRSLGLSMAEAYRYFSGGAAYGGIKQKRDYSGNSVSPSSTYAASNTVYGLAGNAFVSAASTTYVKPTSGCQRNFIIYIGNTTAGGNVTKDNSSENSTAQNMLSAAGGSVTTIPISPSGNMDNIADEWARFMKISPETITTYAVNVSQGSEDTDNSALLKSMAGVSGGKYFLVNSTTGAGSQISDALNNIFSEIQSVNSVFASVSLPVSVNTQGTFLNQVFVGMFRPDGDANPRWNGNLKQYQLGLITGGVELRDAAGANALNSQTGFVGGCARSFWTPSAVDTEWSSSPSGDCLTIADSKASNYPDGNVVEKGGQAYKLRQSSTRTVNTCSAAMASCTALTTFNSTNVTAAQLGAVDAAEQGLLINWAIGKDNMEDENRNSSTTDSRLSMHGDVVHSRPVAVNFGSSTVPNVVVFYGGNDGMLRAINGNQSSTIGTGTGAIPAGGELWSFMPPEFYSSIKRLRNNDQIIQFPSSVTGSPATLSKPYGMDGPITAFQGNVSNVSKTFVYATMRRGGRALYAFDVTNSVTSPSSPTLKWKIGCPNKTNDTNCTTGLSGIGQTWSAAKPFTASGFGSGATPLLVMGGGYDNCEDFDALSSGGANHNCTSSSKGRFVYVLNADTGAVLRAFDTGGTRGVIADVTIVRDNAGQAIYGYTADLGGDVYRITFGNGTAASDNSASWSMTKIASLGCGTTAACTANRKFMFAPSVVAESGDYSIMIGTGDREKPLTYFAAAGAVPNFFFKFTDKPTVLAATYPGTGDCGTAIICLSSLLAITGNSTPSATDLAAKKGWYLGMTSSEQVVTSAVTIFGTVNFSTHQPAVAVTGSCKPNLGVARSYNVKYTDAASTNGTNERFLDIIGGGLSPSPVAGQVTIDGKTVPFCIGCTNEILKPKLPTSSSGGLQPKGRLYWYIQK